VRGGFEQHDELIASNSPDRVLVADRALQSFGSDDQDSVARGVPEAVVDVLEAVDIHKERSDHDARFPSCPCEDPLGAVEGELAVGKPVSESCRA